MPLLKSKWWHILRFLVLDGCHAFPLSTHLLLQAPGHQTLQLNLLMSDVIMVPQLQMSLNSFPKSKSHGWTIQEANLKGVHKEHSQELNLIYVALSSRNLSIAINFAFQILLKWLLWPAYKFHLKLLVQTPFLKPLSFCHDFNFSMVTFLNYEVLKRTTWSGLENS